MTAPELHEIVAGFRDAMARHGLAPTGTVLADGKLHRFDVEGDAKGRRNGFYVLFTNGARPAGMYGSWKTGIKETWKLNGAELSDFERAELHRKVEADRRRREQEETRRHREVADEAARLLGGYRLAPADHAYLARKGVRPHGARVDTQGRLVISMSDLDGRVWSLQSIDADGTKLSMPGGRKRGCMHMLGKLGKLGDRIVVAEGFATAASIHEAAGVPVAVAFDAGNLEPVARAIRQKWPEAIVVVAADDDRETLAPIENPGVHFAGKAAEAVGAGLAIPARREPDGRALDFNDLFREEGPEAVAGIILRALGDMPAALDQSGWQSEALDAALAKMNEDHFVAKIGARVGVAFRETDHELGRERLDFLRPADLKLFYGNRKYSVGTTKDGADIRRDLGGIWLDDPRRPTYRQVALIPKGPVPAGVYNLWRGFGVEPKAGDWSTIDEHLQEVVCAGDGFAFEWLVNWMARCVQHPDKPAEAAVVLRGIKGVGKGMVARVMRRFFSGHALHVTNPRHLVGNFNAHLADTLLLFVDEAFWAGDKTGEGVLKGLVTEPQVTIEPKGIDAFQVPNRLKILIASNSEWVVPTTGDERRYFVLDVSDHRKGDKAYFQRLAAAIEGPEIAAFLHYLLELDLAAFDHRNPPHTKALNEQKILTATSLQRFWLDCLTLGEIVGDLAIGAVSTRDDEPWPEDVVVLALHQAYQRHARDRGDHRPDTIEGMAKELRRLAPSLRPARPRGKPWNRQARPPRYMLPKLDQARADFLRAMNIAGNHEWPEMGDE